MIEFTFHIIDAFFKLLWNCNINLNGTTFVIYNNIFMLLSLTHQEPNFVKGVVLPIVKILSIFTEDLTLLFLPRRSQKPYLFFPVIYVSLYVETAELL